MMTSVVALLLATAGGQASDTTRAAREAFTACLRTYVDESIDAKKSKPDFERDYPQQCSVQESAFRDAVIRRETGQRIARAAAEQAARDEVADARTNFSERFALSTEPD